MNLKDALASGARLRVQKGPQAQPRIQGNHVASTVKPKPDYAPYRSRWEKEYADRLDFEVRGGLIKSWKYEAVRFKIATGDKATGEREAWYRPDFMIEQHTGTLRFDEVKGYERPRAILAWKVAASTYPMFHWRMRAKRDGEWTTTRERRP